jgi:acetyl/propionyl-CoA carboxylase alpha subunit
MRRALREYEVEGIKSNIRFFRGVLEDADFRKGDFDTGFISRFLAQGGEPPELRAVDRNLAVLAAALFHSEKTPVQAEASASTESAWKLDARRRGLRPS